VNVEVVKNLSSSYTKSRPPTLSSDTYDSQSNLIRALIRTRRPETVGQLARMVAEGGEFSETSYVDTIKSMMKDGSIRLGPPSYEIYSVLDYLLTLTVAAEFWLVLLLAGISAIMVYLLPNQFPIVIFRWIFGLILLCLPGYSTIKLLFPSSQIDLPMRLALSVAVSLVVVPIIGFVLNFTPWGIRFQPVLTSLAAYAILAMTAATTRNYFAVVQAPEY